jgi:phosphatidate cytidylyltransferase
MNSPQGSGVLAHALHKLAPATGNGRWSDFGIRLASTAVLGPIALFCVWQGGLAWELFILAAAAGLALEWARLAGYSNANFATWLIVFGIVYPLALVQISLGYSFLLLALTAAVTFYAYGWFAAAGIPYAGIGAITLFWLRLHPGQGLFDTLFLITVIWSTDIGAYLVGRIVGGAKLAPKISPGKTWSGSIGGLLLGGIAGAVLAARGHGIDAGALPAGFLLSFFAQAGDLLESAIKRRVGVKDSGRTIPGHGGLFDRLDGFLAAAPLAAILVFSAQGGLVPWR